MKINRSNLISHLFFFILSIGYSISQSNITKITNWQIVDNNNTVIPNIKCSHICPGFASSYILQTDSSGRFNLEIPIVVNQELNDTTSFCILTIADDRYESKTINLRNFPEFIKSSSTNKVVLNNLTPSKLNKERFNFISARCDISDFIEMDTIVFYDYGILNIYEEKKCIEISKQNNKYKLTFTEKSPYGNVKKEELSIEIIFKEKKKINVLIDEKVLKFKVNVYAYENEYRYFLIRIN